MNEKLPRLTASQIVRQSGSHMIFKNELGRRATVPFHAAKILHPKILNSILADADITIDELRERMR